jgi:drug/metabolite transporter (DMT)-like permease
MNKGFLCAICSAVLFVTLEPVSKLIAGQVSPYAVTLLRFVLGSLILLPFAWKKIRKSKESIGARDWLICLLLGVLFICISMVPLQMAVKSAPSPALIAIIFSSSSVFSLLFAIPINKEKMTKNKLIAVLLCVIGLLFCADFSAGATFSSVAMALFASLTFSLYSVLNQRFMTKLGGAVQNCMIFLIGSLVLFVALFVAGEDMVPEFTLKNIAILCYLGFCVTGLGYWFYFNAIEKGGAIMGSMAFFIKPILTPFVTLVINGVVPGWKIFVAVLFVMLGSAFAVKEKHGKKA